VPVFSHHVKEFSALYCIPELRVTHGVLGVPEVGRILDEILKRPEGHVGKDGSIRIEQLQGTAVILAGIVVVPPN
jgi:hypothetical protein